VEFEVVVLFCGLLVLRKTLFVIMSTISLWFTLFVICINICYNDLDCNNN